VLLEEELSHLQKAVEKKSYTYIYNFHVMVLSASHIARHKTSLVELTVENCLELIVFA